MNTKNDKANPLEEAREIIDKTDKEMARLFETRMRAVRCIAEYKHQNGLPVYDALREKHLYEQNADLLSDRSLLPYYNRFLKSTVSLSKNYQNDLISKNNTVTVMTRDGSYPIYFKDNVIETFSELYDFKNAKVMIVSENGVPERYYKKLKETVSNSYLFVFEQGEENKSSQTLFSLLKALSDNNFNRDDYIVAVGGGVTGDLAGFAASLYMRGIRYINIPTTLLAMVDSSVGGKTAIDLFGFKNLIGAFYPPTAVFTDISLLDSLPQRQISNGLAECIKIAACFDNDLFEFIAAGGYYSDKVRIIRECILLKKNVVEQDEFESGFRRALNFGHTLAHAFESAGSYRDYLHGEAVSIGMLPMCTEPAAEKIKSALIKYGLPVSFDGDINKTVKALTADKKSTDSGVMTVFLNDIGDFSFKIRSFDELKEMIRGVSSEKQFR